MKMKGWKTKLGAALVGAAGIVTAMSNTLPPELLIYLPWFDFVTAVFAAAGTAFLGIGLGHKIEKSGPK